MVDGGALFELTLDRNPAAMQIDRLFDNLHSQPSASGFAVDCGLAK